ncbi:hypothetical protein pqer_cds_231 [Pandoravirus quercus]|uniref:Uncharacterized protein n=1 Tax=Pandoravirus quercus TaxID=2107709 RepID=A0A2U7U8A0_9VIRU|nr:hypothetical protein pqer_cds_231 [Pandoravirus quercus]AVK74653.1 hypothetical protein pqer_cds_231 [Pandoravirus quercus]
MSRRNPMRPRQSQPFRRPFGFIPFSFVVVAWPALLPDFAPRKSDPFRKEKKDNPQPREHRATATSRARTYTQLAPAMSRQSRFNAGFGPQATARPAGTVNGDAFFAGQLGQPSAPGTRSRLGEHDIPISTRSSNNLPNSARGVRDFLQYANQVDAAVGPNVRRTPAQEAAFEEAALSQSQFAGDLPGLNQALKDFAARQLRAGAGGAGAMDIVPRTAPGSRFGSPAGSRFGSPAGSLGQQQAPLDVTGLFGPTAGLLPQQQGAGQVDMNLAAFGQQQQPAFGSAQTRLDQLLQQQAQQQQALGGAATAPAILGGAGQGLGTAAPFAARYRHNSFDGSAGQPYAGGYSRTGVNNAAGQAYAGGYGRNGRRNSVGFGQDGGANPFASQSFAGNYNNSGRAANNFARQYAGQYGNQVGRSNFAGRYGNWDDGGSQGTNNFAGQYGNQAARSNFAGRYGNWDNGGSQGTSNFAGQYNGQVGRSNFAGRYGGQNNGGAQGINNFAGRRNFAGQYNGQANGFDALGNVNNFAGQNNGPRQRRASLGNYL